MDALDTVLATMLSVLLNQFTSGLVSYSFSLAQCGFS